MTGMTITLYTKPNCGPCTGTKRAFESKGIAFEEQQAIDHIDTLRELGYQQAPVVVVTEGDAIRDHWSGLRPDKIEALKAA